MCHARLFGTPLAFRRPVPPTAPINPYAACPTFDADTLSALYDNNANARNQADLKALQACSAAAFESPTLAHERVVLGTGPHAWADVFRPAHAAGPLPALLFVHGGRWELNTSRETAFWAEACCDAGLAFVGLNFPKLSEAGLGAQVAGLAEALAAVQALAASLHLKTNAWALAGHSSGAHLALAAVLHRPGALSLQALLLLGGIYDLTPLLGTTHNAALGFTPEVATAHSPLQRVAAATRADKDLALPPTLVAVGAEESSEFLRQSRALQWALQAHTAAQLCEIPGTAHFDAALSFNQPGSALMTFVTEALAKAPQ